MRVQIALLLGFIWAMWTGKHRWFPALETLMTIKVMFSIVIFPTLVASIYPVVNLKLWKIQLLLFFVLLKWETGYAFINYFLRLIKSFQLIQWIMIKWSSSKTAWEKSMSVFGPVSVLYQHAFLGLWSLLIGYSFFHMEMEGMSV